MPWLGQPREINGLRGSSAPRRCGARLGARSLDPGRPRLDESGRAPRAGGCDLLVGDPVVPGAPAPGVRVRAARPATAAAAQADSARSSDDEPLHRLDALTLSLVTERLE